MARIRTIKPEFFDDEDLAKLSYLARIAFVGLWTQADREGRLEDRPARLRVRLFPYEESVDMGSVLCELEASNFVQRYVVNDRPIVQIRTFAKHQRPHPKEPASTLEPIPADYKNCRPRKNTASHGCIPDISGTGKVELGKEGDLGEGGGVSARVSPPLINTTSHRRHAACGRVCVPDFLHVQFIRQLGGDEREASDRLRDWYGEVEKAWEGKPIGDKPEVFWQARFAEWVGSTAAPSKDAAASQQATRQRQAIERNSANVLAIAKGLA